MRFRVQIDPNIFSKFLDYEDLTVIVLEACNAYAKASSDVTCSTASLDSLDVVVEPLDPSGATPSKLSSVTVPLSTIQAILELMDDARWNDVCSIETIGMLRSKLVDLTAEFAKVSQYGYREDVVPNPIWVGPYVT